MPYSHLNCEKRDLKPLFYEDGTTGGWACTECGHRFALMEEADLHIQLVARGMEQRTPPKVLLDLLEPGEEE